MFSCLAWRHAWVLVPLLAAACTGEIGAVADGPANGGGGSPVPPALPGESATGEGGQSFVRMTSAQWGRSAAALLALKSAPAAALEQAIPPHFHFDTADTLGAVGESTVTQLSGVAQAYVDAARAEDPTFAIWLSANTTGDLAARSTRFAESLLARAFRRAASAKDVADVVALMRTQGGADDNEKLRNGARVAFIVVLQHPSFVYRIALGDSAAVLASPVGGRIPLTGSELASRLSLALFGQAPDQAMIDDAKSGSWATAEGYGKAVDNALLDARAAVGLTSFHEQLYFADRFNDLTKDAALYPEFVGGIQADLRADVLGVIAEVLEQKGGVRELLSTRAAYVTQRTAKLYGLDASTFGATPKRVELGVERAGILTRAGWLARGAGATERSQVQRGVAVLKNVLCESFPNAEPGVFPSTFPADLKTSRKRLESVVGNEPCKGCHSTVINPKGYAFERFDAAGRLQTLDNGDPIDSTGTVRIDGNSVNFTGNQDFLAAVAKSTQAQTCYARRMADYLLGYSGSTMEANIAEQVARESATRNLSARDVAKIILLSPAFTTRKILEQAL